MIISDRAVAHMSALVGALAGSIASSAEVRLEGELLVHNREILRRKVRDQFDLERDVVLDLTDCPYIDSSGLGVLVSLTREAQRKGRTFAVRHPNEDLVTLFELTKLDTILEVQP